jgi:hypothetical protein
MSEQRPSERDAPSDANAAPREQQDPAPRRPACPVCGGALMEIRGKLQCSVCHTICETCCEGGPP